MVHLPLRIICSHLALFSLLPLQSPLRRSSFMAFVFLVPIQIRTESNNLLFLLIEWRVMMMMTMMMMMMRNVNQRSSRCRHLHMRWKQARCTKYYFAFFLFAFTATDNKRATNEQQWTLLQRLPLPDSLYKSSRIIVGFRPCPFNPKNISSLKF